MLVTENKECIEIGEARMICKDRKSCIAYNEWCWYNLTQVSAPSII